MWPTPREGDGHGKAGIRRSVVSGSQVGEIARVRPLRVAAPVLLPSGLKCGPAESNVGGVQVPWACTWTPWRPGDRPAMDKPSRPTPAESLSVGNADLSSGRVDESGNGDLGGSNRCVGTRQVGCTDRGLRCRRRRTWR